MRFDYTHNVGTYLGIGVVADQLMQERYMCLIKYTPSLYRVSQGIEGQRFLVLLAKELKEFLNRVDNVEKALFFVTVILEKTETVKKKEGINKRLWERVDLWKRNHIASLVEDIEWEMKL